jgi:excisionase family DNA binding protein
MSNHEIPEGAFGWTIDQYAGRVQVHRGTVFNWLKKGKLSSIKIDGTRRILPDHDREFRERFKSEAFA